jgi:D-2-hydroxyacid dehydrogenase (NADP+)
MRHITISIDIFQDSHLRRVADAIEGWATWERIPETMPQEEKARRLAGTDIVVGWSPPELLAAGPVTHYLCGSAGFDAYRGHGLENKPGGFTFCNAAGTMSIPIAEHALAMMFALTRCLPWHETNRRDQVFDRCRDARELLNSRVCIAGTGGSGSALAQACLGLGMNVVGVRRDASQKHPVIQTLFPLSQLADAVRDADHVVCTLPASPETANCFNAGIFGAMKPGAFFYNVSRGVTVDGEALISALTSGHLGGAGLDVFDPEPVPPGSPLWTLPNVIITGHSAGWSDRLADRLCDLFVENLLNLRADRPLKNIILL